jgi:quercetin dioxygenase-like cupin family protein
MSLRRRDLPRLIPVLAAAGAAAQEKKQPALEPTTYKYEDLPVKRSNGNESRAVFDGVTHTGYPVEIHVTKLAPGGQPHPPHTHVHEEIVTVKNGRLDVTLNGKTTRVQAGSVISTGSNSLHGWKNPGPDVAEYFVIALGPKS